jgi:hypothetical protein
MRELLLRPTPPRRRSLQPLLRGRALAPFRLSSLGCGPGCRCGPTCPLTARVLWCGSTSCNPLGTVTVTVRENNSSGAIVASGIADGSGHFTFNVPGTYSGSTDFWTGATTTASGYLSAGITQTVDVDHTRNPCCIPSIVNSIIFPDQLALTDSILGSVTLLPSGTFPPVLGSTCGGIDCYWGQTTATVAACGTCSSATIPIYYQVFCQLPPFMKLVVVWPTKLVGSAHCPCDLASADASAASSAIDLRGVGPDESACFPVNLSATNPSAPGVPYGSCSPVSVSYTVTQ